MEQDYVKFGEKLDKIGHYIQENSYVKCVVKEYCTPSCFFVNLLELWNQLESFQDNFNECYDQKKNKTIPPVLTARDKALGMFVAMRYDDKEWFRGQIEYINERTGACRVRSIDYGWWVDQDPNELRYLPRQKFATMKSQSVKCGLRLHPLHEQYLNKVMSKEGEEHRVRAIFKSLVANKDLVGFFRQMVLDEDGDLMWKVELFEVERQVGTEIEVTTDIGSKLIEGLQEVYKINEV